MQLMESIILISYITPLILLYLCILIFAQGSKRQTILFDRLLLIFGMVPGLAGVLYGLYLFLTLEQRQVGLGILTAWLLLEMGALQLRHVYKKILR